MSQCIVALWPDLLHFTNVIVTSAVWHISSCSLTCYMIVLWDVQIISSPLLRSELLCSVTFFPPSDDAPMDDSSETEADKTPRKCKFLVRIQPLRLLKKSSTKSHRYLLDLPARFIAHPPSRPKTRSMRQESPKTIESTPTSGKKVTRKGRPRKSGWVSWLESSGYQ